MKKLMLTVAMLLSAAGIQAAGWSGPRIISPKEPILPASQSQKPGSTPPIWEASQSQKPGSTPPIWEGMNINRANINVPSATEGQGALQAQLEAQVRALIK